MGCSDGWDLERVQSPTGFGFPPYWGAPLEQAQVPGPESAPLEVYQEGWFLLEPL